MDESVPTPTRLPPPPRRVRRRPVSRRRLWILIGLGVVVGGGSLLPAVIASVPVAVHFFGRPTTVVVDSRTYGTGRDSSKRYIHYHYWWNGQTVTDRAEIGLDSYQRVRTGQTLSAQILGWQNRSTVNLTERGFETGVWGGAIGCGLMGLVWTGMAYLIWQIYHRQKWLVRFGTAAAGHVYGKEIRSYKSTEYLVVYNYRSADGKAHGAVQSVESAAYERATAGMAITILYNPRKPERSTIYELGAYEVVGGGD